MTKPLAKNKPATKPGALPPIKTELIGENLVRLSTDLSRDVKSELDIALERKGPDAFEVVVTHTIGGNTVRSRSAATAAQVHAIGVKFTNALAGSLVGAGKKP